MYNIYPTEELVTEELRDNPKFVPAYEILRSILRGEIPEIENLVDVYGDLTPVITDHLESHYNLYPKQNVKLREHTFCRNVISDARTELENNSDYAKLHSLILNEKLPALKDVSPIYGIYSGNVISILKMYNRHSLKRKCGVPAAAHLSRVGGLVHTLGFDEDRSAKFSTVAFLHDCIEDLIIYEKHLPADHHGLKGLEEFFDKHIPEDLQPHVRLLTNQYSLILNYLNYLLTLSDTKTSKESLLRSIDSLNSWDWSLSSNVKKLSNLLNSEVLDEPALVSANWQCYKELYIKEMAKDALENSDFRTFEIKAIDLFDNAHSRGALSLKEKIKNIIKLSIWANQGYKLHSDWEPMNNFIQDHLENALVYSENLILNDFLVPVSKQDYFVSGLYKIEKLRSIFYTD
jgi:hypothetical protein